MTEESRKPIIIILCCVIVLLVGHAFAVEQDLERLETDIGAIKDRLAQTDESIAAIRDYLEAVVAEGKNQSGVAQSDARQSGSDVTETLDYLGDVPKRLGKEAERAVDKILDIF